MDLEKKMQLKNPLVLLHLICCVGLEERRGQMFCDVVAEGNRYLLRLGDHYTRYLYMRSEQLGKAHVE